MSLELFVAALATGGALLALWTHARFPNLAPSSLLWTLVHLVAAVLVLHVVPDPGRSVATAFAVTFLCVLPALAYAFLASIWMLRLLQAAVLSR